MPDDQKDLRSALIRALENRNTGFDVVIAITDAVAADARFNRWVATVAKSESSGVDMLDLVDRYEDLVDKKDEEASPDLNKDITHSPRITELPCHLQGTFGARYWALCDCGRIISFDPVPMELAGTREQNA